MESVPANEQMVDRLISEGALWSLPLIAAFRATPRHCFLPRIFVFQRKKNRWREVSTRDPGPRELELVYSDRAWITHLSRPQARDPQACAPLSSSSQPSLMAQMLEDLKLAPGLRVLEVGAGTGYNAALLAHVVAPGQVLSIDVNREVLSEAWEHLRQFPERQVLLEEGDGRLGYPAKAPFERIMVTAASPGLEPAWLEQLKTGGLLLAPLNLAPGLSYLVRGTMQEGIFRGRLTRPAYFLPLRGEGEPGREEQGSGELPGASGEKTSPSPLAPPPSPLAPRFSGTLSRRNAPWRQWLSRKSPHLAWLEFVHALAFHGLLHGFSIHYRTSFQQQVFFGISQGDSICWFGPEEWEFNGNKGRELGWTLWRKFLDAGGPRPGEFQLLIAPGGTLPSRQPGSFLHQGPSGQQLWELLPDRERPVWS